MPGSSPSSPLLAVVTNEGIGGGVVTQIGRCLDGYQSVEDLTGDQMFGRVHHQVTGGEGDPLGPVSSSAKTRRKSISRCWYLRPRAFSNPEWF